MTSDSSLVIALILFTFAIALALGVYQWRKARAARQQHKHSTVGDLREGLPGATWSGSAPRSSGREQRDASA